MRSQSIWISERSATAVGLTVAIREASDSAEDVGIHQDSGASEIDETKSVESLPLKRRRSQRIISKGAKKSKITIQEESDDPGVECNEGGDDDVINAGNGDDATGPSEEIHDPEECDSYDGAFEDEEVEIPEDDPDEDGSLLEEEEAVPVEDVVILCVEWIGMLPSRKA